MDIAFVFPVKTFYENLIIYVMLNKRKRTTYDKLIKLTRKKRGVIKMEFINGIFNRKKLKI